MLLVLLAATMFLYNYTRSYYNSVQQTMYRRFSSVSCQLKMYTGDTVQSTAAVSYTHLVTRAKDVRSMAEKMISLGKASDLHTKRQVYAYITKEDVAKKLFDEISPKYADRNGGYTRIIKIGARRGDAAEMAVLELV